MQVSIVTPTYYRHQELPDMLKALARQTRLPGEVVLVDGAPPEEMRTQQFIAAQGGQFPFAIVYLRRQGGTAIQRNHGIQAARGQYIFFMDDDVRPNPDYVAEILAVFEADTAHKIGGVAGYRTNQYFAMETMSRWRWYKRLGLLNVFEGGRYDYHNGYPINNNMVPPFTGTRPVDFMTTACSAYRRQVFDQGLRFDDFFIGFGVLEDAHLALSAKKAGWQLVQCGTATCIELNSPSGRSKPFVIAERTCYNYYYVFKSICGPLTLGQKWRFFRFQAFEWLRALGGMLRRPGRYAWGYFWGKTYGIVKTLVKG